MINLLAATGTLGWLIGYIAAVWVGIRERTYAVPLVAVAFNFSYEVVLAAFFLSEKISFFRMIFAAWAVVDFGVLLTVLLWAHRDKTLGMTRRQVYVLVLPLVTVFGLAQTWYAATFGTEAAAFYPAYFENIIMSVLFIRLARRRGGHFGQSFVLAWGKLFGTASMTVLYGILLGRPYSLGCGVACLVLDIHYLGVLHRSLRKAKSIVGRNAG